METARSGMKTNQARRLATVLAVGLSFLCVLPAAALENMVIVGSPSLQALLDGLAQAFEYMHPEVRVRLHYETPAQIRQMISQMQNTGRHHIESGPFHLIAPGGRELITRLEQRYYVLPGSRTTYARARLVLVVPAALEQAPSSFEDLGTQTSLRVAIVDPRVNETGRVTKELLDGLGLSPSLQNRLDIAHDASGVVDHLLHGRADVGIVLNPEAYRDRERIRVVAEAPEGAHSDIVYEIAMERFCPNRKLCEEFLSFTQSPEARLILKRLGYGTPGVDTPARSTAVEMKPRTAE